MATSITADPRRAMPYEALQPAILYLRQSAEAIAPAIIEGDDCTRLRLTQEISARDGRPSMRYGWPAGGRIHVFL
jgi:hypothetical protein